MVDNHTLWLHIPPPELRLVAGKPTKALSHVCHVKEDSHY